MILNKPFVFLWFQENRRAPSRRQSNLPAPTTAKFKKVVKDAKKFYLENFTKRITPLSNPKDIWNRIKALTGFPTTIIRLTKLLGS